MEEKRKKSAMEKILQGLEAPANYLSEGVAKAAGVEAGKDAEDTYFNVVDKAAKEMGLPEDSDVANAAKALAVAGMTYAADPVPFGKFLKAGRRGMQAAKKAAKYIGKTGDATADFGKAVSEGRAGIIRPGGLDREADRMKALAAERLKKGAPWISK